MFVKLGRVLSLFPDGVSLGDYQRINRLIREHGPLITIFLTPGDHVSLKNALDQIDKQI
jgi:hypothetical protein